MTVSGIERKTHILRNPASLRSVLLLSPDHRALDGDDRNAALTTRGISTVLIYCPRLLRFVDAGVRIVRFHGIGLEQGDAVCLYVLQYKRLIVAARSIVAKHGRTDFQRTVVPRIRAV